MSVHDDTDDECRRDFLAWCAARRMLGRDRLYPAFAAGWAYGHATGVDRAIEHATSREDHDK